MTVPRSTPPSSLPPYHPLFGLVDILLDIAERVEAHRATLTEEERAEEDRFAAEKRQREEEAFLTRHATHVDLCEERIEEGRIVWHLSQLNRQSLRERNYEVAQAVDRLCFQARDHHWYPFDAYPHYDATGELPAAPAPNPAAKQFTQGLIARAKERRLGPFKPPAPAPVTPSLSHEEQVEAELAVLLASYKAEERRRATLTPDERAVEDRENDAHMNQVRADAEHERRTMLRLRRDGDDTIHKLSRAEIAARGFQPLFALRQGTEDVYFEADDGAWYRVEAYPEYVRTGTAPLGPFVAPPWEPELDPFMEAVHRFRAITQQRKHELFPTQFDNQNLT